MRRCIEIVADVQSQKSMNRHAYFAEFKSESSKAHMACSRIGELNPSEPNWMCQQVYWFGIDISKVAEIVQPQMSWMSLAFTSDWRTIPVPWTDSSQSKVFWSTVTSVACRLRLKLIPQRESWKEAKVRRRGGRLYFCPIRQKLDSGLKI